MPELGKTLSQARVARGLTLEDCERDTRISKRYLELPANFPASVTQLAARATGLANARCATTRCTSAELTAQGITPYTQAKALQDIKAVESWKHHIQDDEIEAALERLLQPLAALMFTLHDEAFTAQELAK